MARNDLTHSFGFKEVGEDERRRRIRAVFDAVAPRYDLMNDLMSMGMHRWWKRSFVSFCDRFPGSRIIDLAGGTGDIARLLQARRGGRVMVVDASPAMIEAGRRRGGRNDHFIDWLAAEGEHLPFADDSLDLITISFGLRNMTSPLAALGEARRCLRPGGALACLEFSRPQNWFAPLYDLYSFTVIPRLGAMVAHEPQAYQYLIESIRRFPAQKDLEEMMSKAGLDNVGHKNLLFGVACIHWGEKPATGYKEDDK